MIYLASQSPRRRDLLTQLGVAFDVLDLEIDESALPGETPDALVLRLATAKAEAGLAMLAAGTADTVLGADTIVVVDDDVLGKPRDVVPEAPGARTHREDHRTFHVIPAGWHHQFRLQANPACLDGVGGSLNFHRVQRQRLQGRRGRDVWLVRGRRLRGLVL